MSIVLFAIIGASIDAGIAYWVCFALFCYFKVTKSIIEVFKAMVGGEYDD